MAILERGAIAAPTLPKRTVEVPELGGEVIVRGLLLADRLAVLSGDKLDFSRISRLLASTVVLADGLPMWTAAEWEEFGAAHFDAAVRLFDVAAELSGLRTEIAEKN